MDPPSAKPMAVTRTAGLPLLISLADVATNWTGNQVSLAGVNLLTTNNVSVLTNNSWILYPNSQNVSDQINYGIVDSFGGTNVGYINILVNPFVTGQQSQLSYAGNVATVTFYGIPGYTYTVQRSTDLNTWDTVTTTNLPGGSNGRFTVTDSNAPPGSAYYRLKWNP
jgi:hypothetical protein